MSRAEISSGLSRPRVCNLVASISRLTSMKTVMTVGYRQRAVGRTVREIFATTTPPRRRWASRVFGRAYRTPCADQVKEKSPCAAASVY
jgi:hypothetical protein